MSRSCHLYECQHGLGLGSPFLDGEELSPCANAYHVGVEFNGPVIDSIKVICRLSTTGLSAVLYITPDSSSCDCIDLSGRQFWHYGH